MYYVVQPWVFRTTLVCTRANMVEKNVCTCKTIFEKSIDYCGLKCTRNALKHKHTKKNRRFAVFSQKSNKYNLYNIIIVHYCILEQFSKPLINLSTKFNLHIQVIIQTLRNYTTLSLLKDPSTSLSYSLFCFYSDHFSLSYRHRILNYS